MSTWTEKEKSAWRLPEAITVSEWADRHRVLDSRASSEPGQWRTDRTPYVRGMMDAFNDPYVEKIVYMMSAQTGKTESAYNIIGYIIDQAPGPTMLVMPRDDDYRRTVANRIRPMIDNCPALTDHTTGRTWDLSNNEFYFDRMTMFFAGANSPAGLAGTPIKYLILDEVDKYPDFSGKEASPISLAEKRTVTYWDRKVLVMCTPTTPHGNINRQYLRSNQQTYHVPCPACGRYQELIFENLKLPKTLRDPDAIRNDTMSVWYECRSCQEKITEPQKEEMVRRGVWVPKGRAVGTDGRLTGRPDRSRKITGFQASAMISPFVTWAEIMAEFMACNTPEGIAKGDLMNFRNSTLGKTWEPATRKIEIEDLSKKRNDLPRNAVPVGCRCLVGAADYHEDDLGNVRIDYLVKAFAPGLRNYDIAAGSVSDWETFEDEILMSPFPWADPDCDDEELAVVTVFADAGYKPDVIYSWARKFPGLAYPTRGVDGQRTPLQISDLERVLEKARRASRRRSSRKYQGGQLVNISTNFFREMVVTWAERPAGETNSVEFFADLPDHCLEEFVNEQRIVTVRPNGQEKIEWKPKVQGASHYFDLQVNAAAAGYFNKVQLLRDHSGDRTPAAQSPRRRRVKLSQKQAARRR